MKNDKLHFECLPFYQLSNAQLYAIMALRQEVFVVEQDCPYLDADGKDDLAWHLMGYSQDKDFVAYARLLPKGVSYPDHASIGRVVTSSKHRGNGSGKALMEEAMKWMEALWPESPVKLSAQHYLIRFYSSFGFETKGDIYLEDGIDHIAMINATKV